VEWGGYDRVTRAADSSRKIVTRAADSSRKMVSNCLLLLVTGAVGERHSTSADVSNVDLIDSGKKGKNEKLLFFTLIDLAETPLEVSDSYRY